MMGDLLTDRGGERRFESPVVHVVSARDGRSFAALTADGELVLIPRDRLRDPESWTVVVAHDGGLCLAQDCAPDAFLSGGEDGKLVRTFADGRSETLHEGRRWIDCVASTTGHLAFSTGKQIEVRAAEGRETLKVLEHPSTVTGIVFDAKGKRIAASHYNGASMWFVQAKVDTVRPFEWKGSHIAIAIHPGGEALVTSMQENDLHGWRLSDGHNMRMSGYPKQVKSLAFTRNGRWLATAGADAIILWPFFGGGPMGKAPAELARLPGLFVSAVCPNPKEDIIAAGYEDGTVVLAEIGGGDQRVLPLCSGQDTKRGKVTSLGFTPQGGSLVFGTEEGVLAAIDLSSAG
ncbi:MAG: WD40 repeat domain-containing protein [Gluconobacter potus]|uniref:WD40 repeat domain-containing protein n=1 Tax=Gluconobacter potus TaxID=2724927 RepID=A0ABR9YKJ8_9PROT|nr:MULTISPECIES: WD40 repeat domain-containing protein [Gluconobacter]MBF0864130.1 WD40 repeat domain-containing protein [Gluconobacter sp. R71656]MBF0867745.1 WD40 repeat domain-containing protein [Gluconobacter sp. R75628]MBF0872913.1 WD40 repeat domain-containing protein [Gluconobacter sp. R75629]MBF0882159.1 WD40 repeat domain-containing protein [Gluconobacter potus]